MCRISQRVYCIAPVGYLASGQKYTVNNISYDGEGKVRGIGVEECANIKGYDYYKAERFVPASINLELDLDELANMDLVLASLVEKGPISSSLSVALNAMAKINNQVSNLKLQ